MARLRMTTTIATATLHEGDVLVTEGAVSEQQQEWLWDGRAELLSAPSIDALRLAIYERLSDLGHPVDQTKVRKLLADLRTVEAVISALERAVAIDAAEGFEA